MELENEGQLIKIHYYFDDDSHSMDAFVRNKMEREYLKVLGEIGRTFELDYSMETQARQEGGLIEIVDFVLRIDPNSLMYCVSAVKIAKFFQPTINEIATYYLTGKHKKDKLDREEQEARIKKIKNENAGFDSEELVRFLDQSLEKLEQNPKLKRFLSAFYSSAKQYPKIQKIGYQIGGNPEKIIHREEFENFIINDIEEDIDDYEAVIKIVSPILNKSRGKWTGFYNEEMISFSMDDNIFQEDVARGVYNFQNGTEILCHLKIEQTLDENDDFILKKKYFVKRVEKIKIGEIEKRIRLKNINQKTKNTQRGLFDDDEYFGNGEPK